MEEVDKIARRPDSVVVRCVDLCVNCKHTWLKSVFEFTKVSRRIVCVGSAINTSGACSCNEKLNLDYLLEMVWEYLGLIQIYTKKRGSKFTV